MRAASVYGRRLIVALINACQCGIVDDGVVAEALPEIYDHQNERPVLGLGVPGNRGFAQHAQYGVVHKAGVDGQHGEDQIADHDDGDQIRQQENRLIDLLEPLGSDLIEQYGHRDGQHRAQHDEDQIVAQRVAGDVPCVLGLEQILKVAEPRPRAGQYALSPVHVFEGDYNAEHGHVVVDDQIHKARQHHQVIRKAVPDLAAKRGRVRLFSVIHSVCRLSRKRGIRVVRPDPPIFTSYAY